MTIYKRGDISPMVGQIQKALHLIQDNVFGAITEEAVKSFQLKNGLKADGIVGPATLAKLLPCWLRKSRRKITEIIIHCTDTKEGKNYTVDDIRSWHTMKPPKGRGWADIGYHYVIYRDGSIMVGRDVDKIGAHCVGHNANSIGICYVGGRSEDGKKTKDTRTLAQKAALIVLLQNLKYFYPSARVYGHRDFDAGKECPCFDAKKEYKDI